MNQVTSFGEVAKARLLVFIWYLVSEWNLWTWGFSFDIKFLFFLTLLTIYFQVDEDFLASYQMNYGFTPDGEQAVTVSSDSQAAGPHVPQTVQSQVQIKHAVLFTFLYMCILFLLQYPKVMCFPQFYRWW